jgi:hypothetical protein
VVEEAEFEELLERVAQQLTVEATTAGPFRNSATFQERVTQLVAELGAPIGVKIDESPRPYVFPDIVAADFGVEVKFTANDTWRSVANSVLETTRSEEVQQIYVMFGKMGGRRPAVAWGRYEDSVIHVRTSHVPRFELEMNPGRQPLFATMRISYADFAKLDIHNKMVYIRQYARGRLRPGERLWWLEDKDPEDQEHSLPLEVRLYMNLTQEEKRRYRAESALLCPQIVKPSRSKKKYEDAALYLLTYHGILCPQARDLFSAGSVAHRGNAARGGLYIQRALKDIELEMREAAAGLEGALFVEYWGEDVPPDERIRQWLEKADAFATTWVPSQVLFNE